MNYEIVELTELSGSKAVIYSVLMDGDDLTLFDHFVENHIKSFRVEIKSIIDRLIVVGNNTGAREGFFKHKEGLPGDGVCALYDEPDKDLRLYCIRYGMDTLVLGGGGEKSKEIRAWQEDEKLANEVQIIINVAKDIAKRIRDGEIKWSEDRTYLTGDLKFTENDDN